MIKVGFGKGKDTILYDAWNRCIVSYENDIYGKNIFNEEIKYLSKSGSTCEGYLKGEFIKLGGVRTDTAYNWGFDYPQKFYNTDLQTLVTYSSHRGIDSLGKMYVWDRNLNMLVVELTKRVCKFYNNQEVSYPDPILFKALENWDSFWYKDVNESKTYSKWYWNYGGSEPKEKVITVVGKPEKFDIFNLVRNTVNYNWHEEPRQDIREKNEEDSYYLQSNFPTHYCADKYYLFSKHYNMFTDCNKDLKQLIKDNFSYIQIFEEKECLITVHKQDLNALYSLERGNRRISEVASIFAEPQEIFSKLLDRAIEIQEEKKVEVEEKTHNSCLDCEHFKTPNNLHPCCDCYDDSKFKYVNDAIKNCESCVFRDFNVESNPCVNCYDRDEYIKEVKENGEHFKEK